MEGLTFNTANGAATTVQGIRINYPFLDKKAIYVAYVVKNSPAVCSVGQRAKTITGYYFVWVPSKLPCPTMPYHALPCSTIPSHPLPCPAMSFPAVSSHTT